MLNITSLLHCPPYELLSGRITQWFGTLPCPRPRNTVSFLRIVLMRYVESPDRVKAIKLHLEEFPGDFPIVPKESLKDFGINPILAIHDAKYVDYLQTIYQLWYLPIRSLSLQ